MDIGERLIPWYNTYHRDLPWRLTQDPYFIWLSEVILQQTRVDQGMKYYLKFTAHYPTVSDLAKASEDEVLKHWQGLGYYSRARNMHTAARFIYEELDGVFPSTYEGIRALKGVGDYTAAAIASFAYNLPHAVVDGNVYRVLARIFGIDTPINSTAGKKEFQQLADQLLDDHSPGSFNQAMMEFGALQCVPRNPDCSVCPVADQCEAKATNHIGKLPVKLGKTKQRDRYFHYIVPQLAQHTFLQKRTAKDIWQNLFEFPLLEFPEAVDEQQVLKHSQWEDLFAGSTYTISATIPFKKHILSHQRIHATFWRIELREHAPEWEQRFEKVAIKDISNYAVSRLTELFMESDHSFVEK